MKKILLSLTLLSGIALSFGQSVVWIDDFNDEDISDWTLVDLDLDGNNWGDQFAVTGSDGNAVTPVSLISRSWQNGTPLTPDNWAISPAIDLSGASGSITLQYITQVPAASWDEEHYSVYVATSSAISDLEASTVQLSETLGDADNTGTPVVKSLDISDFAGESEVYIAFRHHDVVDMDFISIDDVMVSADVLGVNDVAASTSKSVVYPNPAKEQITLDLADGYDMDKVSVQLTNVAGKSIVMDYAERINISNLPVGVYIMTITDGRKTETKKLIKK